MVSEVSLREEIGKIVGPHYVTDDDTAVWAYSHDASLEDDINPVPPKMVVRPGTIEEIREILRLANDTRTPIYVIGGGTAGSWPRGERIEESIMMDMTRMNEIVEISDEDLTVTTQAGTTWGKLNAELEREGWRLGFRGTYSGYGATVGGGIAFQSNGYGSTGYGVLAEQVTNLKVVLPNGDILKTGTAINPNAGNYYRYAIGPDLTGPFVGSIGAFGVITEASIRIYPEPVDSAFGSFGYKDYESAQECYYEWLKSRKAEDVGWYFEDGIETMVPELAKEGYVSLLTYVVEDVTEELVEARKNLLDQKAEEAGGDPLDPMYAREGWEYKFELLPRWAGKIGQFQWSCHLAPAKGCLRILREILSFLESKEEEREKHDVYSSTISIAHRNAGHVSTSVYFDESNPESVKLAEEMTHEIVKRAAELGGCNYKPGKLWYPHTIMKNPVYRDSVIRLKKVFDPNNIMNPGALTIPVDLEGG